MTAGNTATGEIVGGHRPPLQGAFSIFFVQSPCNGNRKMAASQTSIWAAAARAVGAREPDPRVQNPDWLAERFIGPEERAVLGDFGLYFSSSM